jgi:hypothetical protein
MNTYVEMTLGELTEERTRLLAERDRLQKLWMVDDTDGDWDEVLRDLDAVNRAIRKQTT